MRFCIGTEVPLGFGNNCPKVGFWRDFLLRSSWLILPQGMEERVTPDACALQRRQTFLGGRVLPSRSPHSMYPPHSTCDPLGRQVLWQRPLTTSEKGLQQKAHCPSVSEAPAGPQMIWKKGKPRSRFQQKLGQRSHDSAVAESGTLWGPNPPHHSLERQDVASPAPGRVAAAPGTP